MRRLALVAVAVLLCGCLRHAPPVRLARTTPIAVAFVFDPEDAQSVGDVPDALKQAVLDELVARNLEPRVLSLDPVLPKLNVIRDSQQRFRQIVALAGDSGLVLLVEARAKFFSQLTEQYRWNVYGKLTAGKKGAEPATAPFDTGVFLPFDHDREPQALAAAARTFADKTGELMDQVLAADAAGTAPVTTRAPAADSIYFILVDRFANGDPSNDVGVDRADPAAFHGGDLQGILDHLDYLQSLGVETVWLSPIFKTRTEKFFGHGAFHGYWVEDLAQIDSRFGSVALLRKLADELHRRGMRLMLDVVLNHVAFDSPLLQEHPDWFHHEGELTDWNDPEQLTRRDVKGLPDLAQEKEPVYRYLLDTSLRWYDDVHPDAFRMDAVKHVPLSFWARYDDAVHAHAGSSFTILGEMLDGDVKHVAQVERAGHFDAMFDFPTHFAMVDAFCKGKPIEHLAAVMSEDRQYENPESLVTLLDNHDLPRILTACRGDLEKVRQALRFQLTMRGTPAIQYGTEAGLTGENEPENRADMRFGDGPLRDTIREVLALRREHPALQHGAPVLLEVRDGLLAYARIAPEEAALIVANLGPASAKVAVPAGLIADHAFPARTVTVSFSTGDFSALAAKARDQWLHGDHRRPVVFQSAGQEGLEVVGSSAELGAWDPTRGVPFQRGEAKTDLPVGSVFEYKLVKRSGGAEGVSWEPGDNRTLFVREAEGPMTVALAWNQR